MHRHRSAQETVYIHIGEYFASRKPVVIQTVLGSCVSACLFDPFEKIGGMNHIFLPGVADFDCFNDCARFGVNAMELLINRMLKLGARKKNLVAKVFGGASCLPGITPENHIGKKNSEFILAFLEKESIRIIASNLGGDSGKKILFCTYTGRVLLKHLKPVTMTAIMKKEEKMAEEVCHIAQKPGEITLF